MQKKDKMWEISQKYAQKIGFMTFFLTNRLVLQCVNFTTALWFGAKCKTGYKETRQVNAAEWRRSHILTEEIHL